MNSRFIEDGPVFPAEPTRPPATAALLLSTLGVTFKSAEEQKVAVGGWLKDHTVTGRVRRELTALGLIDSGEPEKRHEKTVPPRRRTFDSFGDR